MNFRTKIFLIALLPFAVLLVVQMVDLQRIIRHSEASLLTHQETKTKAITRQILNLVDRMDKAAVNLSKPREISNAVAAVDNDVLFDWSSSFIGDIDTVFFSDLEGIVLARAPDEFRFGDSIANQEYFHKALADGSYKGTARVDGKESFIVSRAIYKYNDMLLGVVCVVRHITKDVLANLARDESVVLSFTGIQEIVRSTPEKGDIHHRVKLDVAAGDFSCSSVWRLLFLMDDSHLELISLKQSLVHRSVFAVIITLGALLLVLRKQLGPYAVIVRGIMDYADKKLDLETLRGTLNKLEKEPSREVKHLSRALIQMLDRLKYNFQKIEEYNVQLKEMANNDSLTMLRNRRFMEETLIAEVKRTDRYESPLSVLLMDIDHFKDINDTYGHQTGDVVLRLVGTILKDNTRSTDIVGRWGGEEFMIVSPGIHASEAKAFADKLRLEIASFQYPGGLSITASFGVTRYIEEESMDSLIARVDKALYQAKALGRNTVAEI